jgi:murein DD-endopeptidase MepM/ murein hydrolase activator NlpD
VSPQYGGPFSDVALVDTSPYHDPRGIVGGFQTYHGGIDLAPPATDLGKVPANINVRSVTEGTVIRIGVGTATTDFGPNAVVVRTPKGNFATYGHLASAAVSLNALVHRGTLIGAMGYLGLVEPPDVRGTHLHFQITRGAPFGPTSRFLGVTGP